MHAPRIFETSSNLAVEVRERLEDRLQNLPVLPTIVARLLALHPGDDSYFDKVTSLVEKEPNYATRLLSVANAAAYHRGQQPVTRIKDAVVRLGAKHASGVVVALSVIKVFAPRENFERNLWLHALKTASVCRTLAAHLPNPAVDPEQGYLMGLLHDIGHFIIFSETPLMMRAATESCWDDIGDMLEMEREHFGVTHAELGVLASKKWNIPSFIAAVIKNHHEAGHVDLDVASQTAVALVKTADMLVYQTDRQGCAPLHTLDDSEMSRLVTDVSAGLFEHPNEELMNRIRDAAKDARNVAASIGV